MDAISKKGLVLQYLEYLESSKNKIKRYYHKKLILKKDLYKILKPIREL